MDKILIIKMEKENINEFCSRCKSFDCDIDLIDGSNVLDAKDNEHIGLMAFERNFCVSINSNDDMEIIRFNEVMKKYEVKKEGKYKYENSKSGI